MISDRSQIPRNVGRGVCSAVTCGVQCESTLRRPRAVRRGGPMGWSCTSPRMTRARRVQMTSCPLSRWGSRVPSRTSRWIRWSATACRTSFCWGVSGVGLNDSAAAAGVCGVRARGRAEWIPRAVSRGAGRGGGGSSRVAGVGGCVGRSSSAGLLEDSCGRGGWVRALGRPVPVARPVMRRAQRSVGGWVGGAEQVCWGDDADDGVAVDDG